MDPRTEALVGMYLVMKDAVIQAGHGDEVDYVEGRQWSVNVEAHSFLAEHAYVVLNSGFRNATIARLWPDYARAWDGWLTWRTIDEKAARRRALEIFGHRAKNLAIMYAMQRMRRRGWGDVWADVTRRGVDAIAEWPYMGPVVRYHLARNLGLDFVKPDRHMERIASRAGYVSPVDLCKLIADVTGDRIGTVDVVLWRYAVTFPDYLDRVPEATP